MLYGDLISLTRTFVDNITNQTIKWRWEEFDYKAKYALHSNCERPACINKAYDEQQHLLIADRTFLLVTDLGTF
jgi:hypothetical protein